MKTCFLKTLSSKKNIYNYFLINKVYSLYKETTDYFKSQSPKTINDFHTRIFLDRNHFKKNSIFRDSKVIFLNLSFNML